jgi:hypothetical protein
VKVRTGDRIELAIDPSHLHAFDPGTGAAIDLNGASVRAVAVA